MARISDPFAFTGSISNLSAYKMRGVEGIILRTKGGPSKNKIKSSPRFEKCRQNNNEFGIRSVAVRMIMKVLNPLKPLADHNIAGPLNSLLRHAQQIDTESQVGERYVLLSKKPEVLNSFSLNRKLHFDTMVRTPVTYKMSVSPFDVKIFIPALMPSVNLHLPAQYSLYSFIAVIGIVPDIGSKSGIPVYNYPFWDYWPVISYSPWYGSSEGNDAMELNFTMPTVSIPSSDCSVLIGIGLRFGQAVTENEIGQVKYAGCAKVLGCEGMLHNI